MEGDVSRRPTLAQSLALGWLGLALLSPIVGLPGLVGVFLGYFPPAGLWFPAGLVGVVALIRLIRKKSRPFDRWFIVALTLVILPLGNFEFPSFAPKPEGPALRVLTLNVLKTSRAMPGLIELVQRERIDIVLLQENLGEEDSPGEHLVRAMPGWHIARYRSRAIVSRWPLTNVRRIEQPIHILTADVGAPQPFRAISLHWRVTRWNRGPAVLMQGADDQWRFRARTVELVEESPLPVLYGGDFNCTPRGGPLRNMPGENAFSKTGWGFGFSYPSIFPLVRIDHLYGDKGLVPVESRVVGGAGSDHAGLVAEFRWTRSDR